MKLFAVTFCMFVTLLGANLAAAEEFWGGTGEVAIPANIRGYQEAGLRMVPGGECEKVLVRFQQKLGRDLTYGELADFVRRAVLSTKEELIPVAAPAPSPAPSPPRGFSCFTGKMLVLTPTGERPISELRPGDEVISYDFANKKIITNKIFAVYPYDNQVVRVLSDLNPNIEVTRRHQFLTGQGLETQFKAIEEIGDHENVYSLSKTKNSDADLRPQKRGRYQLIPGTHKVYDLQLIGEPRNFILEGIIVHNVIIKC